MTTFRLDWNGDAIRKRIDEAVRKGIDQTTAATVAPAKANTPVRTGRAQGSIQFRPAERRGNRWVGLVGSFNVNYFIWLEIGTRHRKGRHMLRRAADQEFPKLGERIKQNLRGGNR